MSLKMRQRYQNIRIHHRLADLRLFYVLPVYRDERLVRPFEPVRYDHMASGGKRGKAVGIGRVDVVQGIFAGTDIKRITVREKRFSAPFLHKIRDHFRIIGTQKSQVAVFPEMNLDRRIFILKINLSHARGKAQTP